MLEPKFLYMVMCALTGVQHYWVPMGLAISIMVQYSFIKISHLNYFPIYRQLSLLFQTVLSLKILSLMLPYKCAVFSRL